MKEVILNDECAYCNDKECHDGEHFCNQAMKENSFYKNAELYRGLEVIRRPTYEELEEENAELKEALKNDKVCKCSYYLNFKDLEKENIKAKEIIKSLLRLWNDVMTEETVKALIAEAEQFISEVEK